MTSGDTMHKLEIYGTLGPSCCQKETIVQLLEAGMTGMRLNLSHCNLWERKQWLDEFHAACVQTGINADLMIDMRGPELRVNELKEPLLLEDGQSIELTSSTIPKSVIHAAEVGDKLMMDDGKIHVIVTAKENERLVCNVVHGGILKSRKSVAIEGKTVQGDTLTESDILNIQAAKQYGVTSIMQPFVNSKQDLIEVKRALKEAGADYLRIFTKIETLQGFEHIDELLKDSDQIVIARGDLGNAAGLIRLPAIQKQIEQRCKQHNKPYMVVTEMLHSMQENPTPTRAEVSDVFHAVYHGASSIMLTGETAGGKYPVEAMKVFVGVAKEAQKEKEKTHVVLD